VGFINGNRIASSSRKTINITPRPHRGIITVSLPDSLADFFPPKENFNISLLLQDIEGFNIVMINLSQWA
jgi:hypothetical protein